MSNFFCWAFHDVSILPIVNSFLFGFPRYFKSVLHNLALALCCFTLLSISCALILSCFADHNRSSSKLKALPPIETASSKHQSRHSKRDSVNARLVHWQPLEEFLQPSVLWPCCYLDTLDISFQIILLGVGTVLCAVGCLAAFLASSHYWKCL